MPDVEPTPLTPTDPGPVMISWAHRPNDGVDADTWRDTIVGFAAALWGFNIKADCDLYHLHQLGVDWSQYGPQQIRKSAHTIVAVNAAWRERFDKENKPTEGAGVVAEVNELLGIFARDQNNFESRVLLVILPGASADDVPNRLTGINRFPITEFTEVGMKHLLLTLTGQPLYVPPPAGTALELPATVLGPPSATVEAAAEMSAAGTLAGTPLEAELRDQEAVLGAVQRAIADQPRLQEALAASAQGAQLRSLAEAVNRALFSSLGFQEVQRTTVAAAQKALFSSSGFQEVQRTAVAAAQKAIGSSLAGSAGSVGAVPVAPSRLVALLAQVSEAVERENRCWLLLAGAFEDPDAAVGEEHDGRSVRQRRQEQVSTWISRTFPPVPLGREPDAVRNAGRVVLSAPSAATDAALTTWRLELGDHGEAVAAANVAGDVVPGSPFDPPEDGRRQYPELHLPVRADLLELWLLTQVQLIADHLASIAADRTDATVFLQARLLLPEHLSHPEAYPRHGVRLVAATRDEDGHRSADSAVPGATDLQLGLAPPEVGPLTTTVEALSDPARLVRITQSIAVELLDPFGVEDTSVVRPDGTLDELAAADQQAVWEHAGAMGLVRDEVSPTQRRQRYDELLAQARAALRR